MIKKIVKWVGIIIIPLLLVAGVFFMVYLKPFLNKIKTVNTIAYDSTLTIVTGGGGNSGIVVSDSLVLVIDTKMDEAAEAFHKQVMALAGKRPILIINTHIHPDHTQGNHLYLGQQVVAGANYTPALWSSEAGKENLPTQWLKDKMEIVIGNDTATIINLGKNIHTQSDIMVYFHQRKLLFTGDVVLNKQAPFLLAGANPAGYIATMNTLPSLFDIKTIVPGHGAIGGIEVLNTFKTYFMDMKEAASNSNATSSLVSKYDTWSQIPFIMSTGSTMSAFNKLNK